MNSESWKNWIVSYFADGAEVRLAYLLVERVRSRVLGVMVVVVD